VQTRIIKSGDDELRNDLVTHEEVSDDEFGKHIFSEEGQLTVDVYQTDTHLVIVAPVAGVEAEDLNVTVSDKEVLTVSGSREMHREVRDEDFLSKECFWGAFSRSIVLPDGLDVEDISATFRRGVLKIEIPKIKKQKKKKIKVKS